MITEFIPGARVRWNIPDGGLAEIVRYLGEGYYLVKTIPEGRELVAAEYEIKKERESCDLCE